MTLPRFLDEPAVGEQVADHCADIWQRFKDGWHWWSKAAGRRTSESRAWDCPVHFAADEERP